MIADEIYQDVAFDGPIAPIGALDPDAPVISLSGLSKGYLVPGWRTGWLVVGGGDRLKDVLGAITKLAEGRLCSTMPMQRAVVAALNGRPLASTGVSQGAARARRSCLHAGERIPGFINPPDGGVLRDAEIRSAAWENGCRLHYRPGARNRRAVRSRIGIRHGSGGRVFPHGDARTTRTVE